MKRQLLGALALSASLLVLGASPASAAHNGNNRAELSGEGSSGNAVVNYSEGQGTFNGTTKVTGLEPGETYTFTVNLNGDNPQEICEFVAGRNGAGGCAAQGLPLAGFSQAAILDDAGATVASGTFDRRGNCRDPQQAASQCEAPGQNR